jgi:hypothetical protein
MDPILVTLTDRLPEPTILALSLAIRAQVSIRPPLLQPLPKLLYHGFLSRSTPPFPDRRPQHVPHGMRARTPAFSARAVPEFIGTAPNLFVTAGSMTTITDLFSPR